MFDAFDGIAGSLIAASGLAYVAYLSFVLNRRTQIEATWRSEKLTIYKEFSEALGANLVGEATPESHRRFARASNNLLLIAFSEVLEAHHRYREHIKVSSTERDYDQDGPLLAALLSAMRRDLDMKNAVITPTAARLWSASKNL